MEGPIFSVYGNEFSNPSPDQNKKPQSKKLSCAECRRLKVKCDRQIPCEACKKKGCASICPNGSMARGKGTRMFVLTETQELHEHIATMSQRISALEEALRRGTAEGENHPLLHPDLQNIKHPPDTLISFQAEHNRAERQGEGNASMQVSTSDDEGRASYPDRNTRNASTPQAELYSLIRNLSSQFPFPWQPSVDLRVRILEELPPEHEAKRLCKVAQDNAFWQYNLDPNETFLGNVLHHVYANSVENINPRRLSLVLLVLAIGCHVDVDRPNSAAIAEQYFHFGRVAACELPIVNDPNEDLLHAMFYIIWYMLIFSEERSSLGSAWGMMGLAIKEVQLLFLHRKTSRKLIPEELERQQQLLWEYLNLEARLSLTMGRPASYSLKDIDCGYPAYALGNIHLPGDEVTYHQWKHHFYVTCLSPILELEIAPRYEKVVEIDTIIRNYRIPPCLNLFDTNPIFKTQARTMQQAIATTSREIAIIHLHRPYFFEALTGSTSFTIHHPLAPSVVAMFNSAQKIIRSVERIYGLQPQLGSRFVQLWFNAVSAAVALAIIVSRAPSAPMAPFALPELGRACTLFRQIADLSPRAAKALPLLVKLTDRSYRIYHDYVNTGPQLPRLYGGSTPFETVHIELRELYEELCTASPPYDRMLFNVRTTPQLTGEEGAGHNLRELLNCYIGRDYDIDNEVFTQLTSPQDCNRLRMPDWQTVSLDFGASTDPKNYVYLLSFF